MGDKFPYLYFPRLPTTTDNYRQSQSTPLDDHRPRVHAETPKNREKIQAHINIHAMSPFPIYCAATAARMKAASPSIRPKISAQNTTTLTRKRFYIIPDIKTRRIRPLHLQNGFISLLPHLDAPSLSTNTLLHPSFLFLSSMSAIDPVASVNAIASSSSLNDHQLIQQLSMPGTGDIQSMGIRANKALSPFAVLMLRYQALSAPNETFRMENRICERKYNDYRASDNGKGDGDEIR